MARDGPIHMGGGPGLEGPKWYFTWEPPCEQTDRQTRAKTLPARKLRMRTVKRFETCCTKSPCVEKIKQHEVCRCKES